MSKSSSVYDYSELRGRIKAKLHTEGEFARRISRTQQYISNVFCGKSFFEARDITNACDVLDISVDDIGKFFYTKNSQM